ncbi:MAG: DNA repair protein RecO C-terminal domain-containing protein, partial [Bacteroidia bacterium]|nr:DNA repair protein RecO C-terminal domain-containing protein [Bacteroidia bacterium]
VYSVQEGVTDLIKKGRRPPIQPLGLYEFVYRKKPGYEMFIVRECSCTRVHRTLHDEPLKMMYGMYAAEIFLSLVVEREPNERLFRRLKSFLIQLDESPTALYGVTTRFLADLTAIAGYSPAGLTFDSKTGILQEGDLGDEAGRWMSRYFSAEAPPEPPASLRPKIWEAFLRFWQWHIPEFRRPKSWDVFREFFEPAS